MTRAMLVLSLLSSFAWAEDFDSNGCKIHYLDVGKGEPVLLVHGMDSSAFLNWQAPGIVDALSKDYRVIAPDLRGHGASDRPEGEDAYGVQMVEDLVRLLDHLRIEKTLVAGYSMGGMVTMKFLVLHGDRVKAAVLGGMGWFKEGGLLGKVFENMHQKDSKVLTPDACTHSISKLEVTEEQVKAIKFPVTVIVGDKDPCRLLYVKPLEGIRPDWKVNLVEGAGHINCIVKPEFTKLLKSFLDEHARDK